MRGVAKPGPKSGAKSGEKPVTKSVVYATLWCCCAMADGAGAPAQAFDWPFFHARHHHHHHWHSASGHRRDERWQNWETYRSQYRSSRGKR